MSRVDEALRRAEAMPRLAGPGHVMIERPDARRDRLSLEDYPREPDPPADPAPAPPPPGRRPNRTAVTTPLVDRLVTGRFGRAYEGKLVASGHAHRAAVEQYRRLGAALHHLHLEQGLQRLMVTSSLPQEGKTLTVTNLAMTLSESYGRRVLLIDADLRQPSIHEVFGISNRFGLCDALRTDEAEVALCRVAPALWVLPAGSAGPNPMTTLTSQRMERFLDEVTASFDWILLDAPPVALMADAGLLARFTRAVLLVVGAGATAHAMVEKTVAELGREHIVGTVLNRVEDGDASWSDYYGGYVRSATPLASGATS